jgi:hypothetical protein
MALGNLPHLPLQITDEVDMIGHNGPKARTDEDVF